MRRLNPAWGALAIVLLLAAIAAAQGTARLVGQILDLNGKPYPDVIVEIKNPDNNQTWTTKTDKDGRFAQLGLLGGIYNINFKNEKDNLNFPVKFSVSNDKENVLNLNFKEIMAQQAPTAEEAKKKEDEDAKFKNVKLHFDNGVKAMTDANALQTQIRTAPADQRSSLQQQRIADCVTALSEFQQAEQGISAKEVANHAMVLGNLGGAAECAGKYDDASAAFQKASELKPQPNYYLGYATNLANVGASLTDAKASAEKFADANGACEKAIALDPAVGAICWKNLGIVLSNKNRQKDAVGPLQKAVQADPKDAQAWFLLGSALSAGIEPKQEGEKMIYIIPPGTAEAYQKCIDAAPNGPYAGQAKDMLAGLAAMGGGEQTSLSRRKKKE